MRLDGWWKNAFEKGAYPLERIAATPTFRRKTKEEIPFLLRLLKLAAGSELLDVCCGIGRHSIPFALKRVAVTGADISARYLREAGLRGRRAGVDARFLRRDIRKLGFRNRFDAAINLYSSFGYFPRACDDARALRSIRRALKPGGLFFIDTFNGTRLEQLLRWQRWLGLCPDRWSELPDGTLVLEKPELMEKLGGVRTRWRFIRGAHKREMVSFTRIYTRQKLCSLLNRTGFRVLRVFGEVGLTPHRPSSSPRLAILAQRA